MRTRADFAHDDGGSQWRSLARLWVAAAMLWWSACSAHAGQPIRIAFVDAMSGSFANVGEGAFRHLLLAVESVNRAGGVLGGRKLEVLPFDGKANPQESILALRSALDQGHRIVFHGAPSSAAFALVDAVEKHVQRNPADPILLFNYAALDPALTNERCSFWHFRFDADVPMRMKGLAEAIARRADIRKIYLINQDYSYGQSVARAVREMLFARRPDIEIVGDDLHTLGAVKDFSPYVAKIKASGAHAVVTGNWGNDLNFLVKAARALDLAADIYTNSGASDGAPTAIGKAGVGRMKVVTVWHANIAGPRTEELVGAWKQRFPDSPTDLDYAGFRIAIAMLVQALEQVGNVDLRRVALAMENMRIEDDAGEVWMRADNHQLIQPMFVSTFMPVDGRAVKHDLERTGFGLRTDMRIEAKDTGLPTTCRMRRP